MSNKQKNTSLDQFGRNSGALYGGFLNNQADQAKASYDNATGLRSNLTGLYGTGGGGTTGFMSSSPNASGWYDLPGNTSPALSGYTTPSAGGHAAGGDFSSAKAGYQGFADTGNAQDFADAKSAFTGFLGNGGVDATALRNRATDIIPSFYQQYKQQAQTAANRQGGYAPGFDAQQAEMARQAGREGFQASRAVEGDIAQMEQQGKEFGASGLGSIDTSISGNRLAGLGGLTNIGQYEQQNNQFNAGLDQSNNQFNAGLYQNNSQFNAGQTQAADTRNLGAQLQLQGMGQQGREFAASGLSDIYKTDVNANNQANQNYLAGLGGMSAAQLAYLQQRYPQKSTNWGSILGGIGNVFGMIPWGGGSGPNNGQWTGPTQVDENGNPVAGPSLGIPGYGGNTRPLPHLS